MSYAVIGEVREQVIPKNRGDCFAQGSQCRLPRVISKMSKCRRCSPTHLLFPDKKDMEGESEIPVRSFTNHSSQRTSFYRSSLMGPARAIQSMIDYGVLEVNCKVKNGNRKSPMAEPADCERQVMGNEPAVSCP